MSTSKSPRSKHPVSARGVPPGPAANRADAASSTGPKTPEGKARSAQNSRRHGFAAAGFAVANLKADLVCVYRPVNSQELFAIERMALAQQALLRAARLESGLFTTCLNDALDASGNPIVPMTEEIVGDLEVTRAQNRNFALADGFRRIAQEGNTWTLLLRYQAQVERRGAPWARRAVEEFECLKTLRQELPNGPIFEDQPEEKPTPSASPGSNPTEPGNAAPKTESGIPACAHNEWGAESAPVRCSRGSSESGRSITGSKIH